MRLITRVWHTPAQDKTCQSKSNQKQPRRVHKQDPDQNTQIKQRLHNLDTKNPMEIQAEQIDHISYQIN